MRETDKAVTGVFKAIGTVLLLIIAFAVSFFSTAFKLMDKRR